MSSPALKEIIRNEARYKVGLNTTREAIYTAFFNLLTGISITDLQGNPAPFKRVSRHLRTFDDISTGAQPALMLEQVNEHQFAPLTGLPYNWRFNLVIWILYKVDVLIPIATPTATEQYAVTLINRYMDAVEAALDVGRGAGQGKQSLGGLVTDARISGATEVDDGRVDNQACLRIPAMIIADR